MTLTEAKFPPSDKHGNLKSPTFPKPGDLGGVS